jgi:hypothetical protein
VEPCPLLWHVGIGSGWTPEVRNGLFAFARRRDPAAA